MKGEATAARKQQRVELLKNVELITDPRILETLMVDKLKEQLAKYRTFDRVAKETTGVRKRDQYLEVLLPAAERYMRP